MNFVAFCEIIFFRKTESIKYFQEELSSIFSQENWSETYSQNMHFSILRTFVRKYLKELSDYVLRFPGLKWGQNVFSCRRKGCCHLERWQTKIAAPHNSTKLFTLFHNKLARLTTSNIYALVYFVGKARTYWQSGLITHVNFCLTHGDIDWCII